MADSDSDYFDLVEQENVIEDVNDAPRPRVNQDGQRVQGKTGLGLRLVGFLMQPSLKTLTLLRNLKQTLLTERPESMILLMFWSMSVDLKEELDIFLAR